MFRTMLSYTLLQLSDLTRSHNPGRPRRTSLGMPTPKERQTLQGWRTLSSSPCRSRGATAKAFGWSVLQQNHWHLVVTFKYCLDMFGSFIVLFYMFIWVVWVCNSFLMFYFQLMEGLSFRSIIVFWIYMNFAWLCNMFFIMSCNFVAVFRAPLIVCCLVHLV